MLNMFHSRVPESLTRNSISEALDHRRAAGLPILDLTESNPTRAGIVYPTGEILEGFQNPKSLIYDPASNGLMEAREQIAGMYGVAVEQVVLTASSSEAYSWIFKLLCGPWEQIVTPRPSYPLFEGLASLECAATRQYPLRYDDGWFIDFEPMERAISLKTRAIVVVNPNNPTGSYLRQWELDRLCQLCAKDNLALISDEVFSDYALDDSPSLLRTIGSRDDVLSFRLGGLSKMCGLPQMKLGWMIVNGPRELREEALRCLDWIADHYLSVGTPVQYALPQLLAARAGIQGQILARLRANLVYLREQVRVHDAFRVLKVQGGWYAIVQVPRVRTEEEWVLHLIARGVLVQPGFFYDLESEAYLVVSLLTPEPVFRAGLEVLFSSYTAVGESTS